MVDTMNSAAYGVSIVNLNKSFGTTLALDQLTAHIPYGCLTGIAGPDGAGKTTLLRLLAGLLTPDSGQIRVAEVNVIQQPESVHPLIGYMPQRFGLYEDLSVEENLTLYARLRSVAVREQNNIFAHLLEFTRLAPFTRRLAGQLSGGMKQKLGLACALMGKPRVLLLDEPGVGVDPVSRQDLWEMVQQLTNTGMAVLWSTAYLDEAERCDSVLLLDRGRIVFDGIPQLLTARLAGRCVRLYGFTQDKRLLLTQALDIPSVADGVIQGEGIRLVSKMNDLSTLTEFSNSINARLEPITPRFEDAFIDLLERPSGGHSVLADHYGEVPTSTGSTVFCADLSCRFGAFLATDRVSFALQHGEIFGLLGPNGAGKSTTFRMLCGLLKPTSGVAKVMDIDLRHATSAAKQQLGYMAQRFSLYGLLSVLQNLKFFAGAYGLNHRTRTQRIDEMVSIFDLQPHLNAEPNSLSLGIRQRLALACSLMHRPPVLFLDEPTSGVDPLTRREFWTHINGLAHKGVTVLVTTHFMEEAEYCDRVALMVQGKVIALNNPDSLKKMATTAEQPDPTMEQTFVQLITNAAKK